MNIRSKTLAVATLGCKVNQYDTDAVLTQFLEAGYTVVDFDEKADVYIINTCTVTNMGDRKSRQMIRRAYRNNPSAKVVVMGCLAQTSPEEVGEIEGVNLIVGTDQRGRILELVESLEITQRESLVEDIFAVRDFEELSVTDFAGRTRAVIKIQDGCNQFCSYCRVPYARGRSRSRHPQNVIDHVESVVRGGFKEIVLTGIHLGLYGRDLNPPVTLESIIRQIADIPGVLRLRLGSIEPHEITDQLLELVANNPVVCEHLHIPLQSGSDRILERMRRSYTTGEYREIVEKVRAEVPELAVTTDIIVGFPGETEQDFLETMEFAEEMGFSRLHVFKYSKREGTPAASFPQQIPNKVKDIRSKRLIKLGHSMAQDYHRLFLGKTVYVLVEEVRDGMAEGLTNTYIRSVFPTSYGEELVGQIIPIRAIKADKQGILGECV